MESSVLDSRNKVPTKNLNGIHPFHKDALKYISDVASNNGKFLFVGTKRAASDEVKDAALKCGQFYVNKRWLGGMLTNWKTIPRLIQRLKELEQQKIDGTFEKLTVRQALLDYREMRKLENSLGGIKDMCGLPDCIFVIDDEHEHIAVDEASNLGIPVICFVNDNANIDKANFEHIFRGDNNDVRTIRLYSDAVAVAINQGKGSQQGGHGPLKDTNEFGVGNQLSYSEINQLSNLLSKLRLADGKASNAIIEVKEALKAVKAERKSLRIRPLEGSCG